MKKILLPLFLLISLTISAQTPHTPEKLSESDYAKAENALWTKARDLVYYANVRPIWINDHQFYYQNTTPKGKEFILVDAQAKTKKPAFDQTKLAATLSKLTGENYEAYQLPFRSFEYTDGKSISFKLVEKQYIWNPKKNTCKSEPAAKRPSWKSTLSPDGTKAAFTRDNNLWYSDLETEKETQLTTDGIEDFGYATNNAGWMKMDKPVVLWSPDSKKIATFQHDGRGVSEMHLVKTVVGAPELKSWKYPLPGDSVIFRVHRVIIDVDSKKITKLKMEPDQHRSSFTDHIAKDNGDLGDAEWSEDSKQLAFLSNSRDHKEAILRIADAGTGDVRTFLEEEVKTFFESGYNQSNWHVLAERNEVIWYSQRNNWGNLYLYDLKTGKLKNTITKGDWNVLRIKEIDRENGVIYFIGNEREEGDPYYQYLYSVHLDGSNLTLLSKGLGNHSIRFSPKGDYFVDNKSMPDVAPEIVLRNKKGTKIMDLEKADISKLLETGWKPPVNFTVKGRDGKTDIYGMLFKPIDFDLNKKYPIINYIYPGPQSGSVGSRSFSPARGDKQALANLGFIVVAMDAMGTPLRSKSFHDAYYGNMGDNGLPDQVTGMKQLAERHPWIDLERVGIYGHSGGGYASTDAMFRYPDFFKVAVSGAGNHDNRNYEDDWGEKWQGMLKTKADGTTNYDNQANQLVAENLKGKLLLAHGTMDDNVPPYNTLLVVDKLIAANKDFDLLMMPNRRHGLGIYYMRKRWDYFVTHLLGAEPPKEFEFGKVRP